MESWGFDEGSADISQFARETCSFSLDERESESTVPRRSYPYIIERVYSPFFPLFSATHDRVNLTGKRWIKTREGTGFICETSDTFRRLTVNRRETSVVLDPCWNCIVLARMFDIGMDVKHLYQYTADIDLQMFDIVVCFRYRYCNRYYSASTSAVEKNHTRYSFSNVPHWLRFVVKWLWIGAKFTACPSRDRDISRQSVSNRS